ncbi:hypothetical protein [Proteus hauseri]|uniref:hypothetical protein n=1 Tax=Proteus hauseri TaxID=183417 RepID=UPI0007E60977|nr:hypothetical protein [Proteus hauseri]
MKNKPVAICGFIFNISIILREKKIIKKFQTLSDLLASCSTLESNEWIYTEIVTWNSHPDQAIFYYIPWDYIQELPDDEIYLDDEDMEMPKIVEGKNLRGWMLICDLSFLYQTQQERRKDLSWTIDEINYYREYDAYRCLFNSD